MLGYCEDPPVDWCCEECDTSNKIKSLSHVLENESSDNSKLHFSAKMCHNTVQPMKPRKFSGGNCINWEKEVQTGKTRYLPVGEAISLSSGVKKYGSLLKISGSSRPVAANSMANVSEGNRNKPRAQVRDFSTEKSKLQHSLGATGYSKPQIRNIQATELTKRPEKLSKENSKLGAAMKRIHKFVAWNQSAQSRDNEEKRPRNQPEGRGDSTIPELRSPKAVNASQMGNPPNTCPSVGRGDSTIPELRSPKSVNASQMGNPPKTGPSVGRGDSTIPVFRCPEAVNVCQMGNPHKTRSSVGRGDSTIPELRSPKSVDASQMGDPPKTRPSVGRGDSTIPEFRSPEAVNVCQKGNPPKTRPSVGRGDSTIPELQSPEVVNASQRGNPQQTCPCDPALVHTWKGSFDIIGDIKPGGLNNQIRAHPPSRVHRMVYEFSSKMPGTLRFELVPRGDIWTSIFPNHCPSKQDIGLYLFTDEGKRSDILMGLVEFMHTKDLVMRTIIDGVELLVLASTVLSSDSRWWNSEYFLWGLFHCVRKDISGCAEGGSNEVERGMTAGEDVCTINEVDMEDDMEIDMIAGEDVCTTADEVDMEIDMIAGENVGRVDICVSTSTARSGFDSSLRDIDSAATCDRSKPVTSPVSRTSKCGKELPRVEIKREPVNDFPPGFTPKTPK